MSKEILFEATVNGETIDLGVTRKNDIMIEASDDGYISRDDMTPPHTQKVLIAVLIPVLKDRLLNPAILIIF